MGYFGFWKTRISSVAATRGSISNRCGGIRFFSLAPIGHSKYAPTKKGRGINLTPLRPRELTRDESRSGPEINTPTVWAAGNCGSSLWDCSALATRTRDTARLKNLEKNAHLENVFHEHLPIIKKQPLLFYWQTTNLFLFFCRIMFDGKEEIRNDSLETNVALRLSVLVDRTSCQHELLVGTG